MRTQVPGYLALLYGRARTLASVGLTPANGFSGQTASGCAGVAGSTLEHHRRETLVCLHRQARRTSPPPLPSDGEGGMQLAGEATNLAGLRRSIPRYGAMG